MAAACAPSPSGSFKQAAACAGWDEAALECLGDLSISPVAQQQQKELLQQQNRQPEEVLELPPLDSPPGQPSSRRSVPKGRRAALANRLPNKQGATSVQSPIVVDLTGSPDPPGTRVQATPVAAIDSSRGRCSAAAQAGASGGHRRAAATQTTPPPAASPVEAGAARVRQQLLLSAGRARKLRDEFECSICYELYDQPTSLECGHSFCFTCLESCLARCGRKCPTCRAHVACRTRLQTNTVLANTICLLYADELAERSNRKQVRGQRATISVERPTNPVGEWGLGASSTAVAAGSDDANDPALLAALTESRHTAAVTGPQRQHLGGGSGDGLGDEVQREERRRRRAVLAEDQLLRTLEDEWLS